MIKLLLVANFLTTIKFGDTLRKSETRLQDHIVGKVSRKFVRLRA